MSITTIITTVCFSLFYTLHIFFHNYIIFCFMFILLFKCKPTDDSGQNSSPVFCAILLLIKLNRIFSFTKYTV